MKTSQNKGKSCASNGNSFIAKKEKTSLELKKNKTEKPQQKNFL